MNWLGRGLCLAVPLLLAACAESPPMPVQSPAPVAGTAPQKAAPASPTAQARPPVVTKRGGGFYKDDGPGENPPADMDAIPDAEPHAEPLLASANRPYNALGQTYVPLQQVQPYSKRGVASWYGRRFNGKPTSSGEPYDMYAMTAAHPTLPIPSYVRVTNLANDKSVIVRVNDRGPFHSSRIIDLSYTAAWKLGYVERGSAEVMVEAIVPDEMDMVLASSSRKPARKAPAPVQTAKAEPAASGKSAGGVEAPTPTSNAVPVAAAVSPVAVAAATVPSPAATGSIYLQLGAFATKAHADSFRDYVVGELKWLTQGVSSQFGGDKYRLHLGPFLSVEEAREVAGKIAQAIKLRPFLVMR